MPSLSAGYLAVFTVGIALRVLISRVSAWGESLIDVLEFATPLDRLDLLRELPMSRFQWLMAQFDNKTIS
mgnify:CR=1 FL=1